MACNSLLYRMDFFKRKIMVLLLIDGLYLVRNGGLSKLTNLEDKWEAAISDMVVIDS